MGGLVIAILVIIGIVVVLQLLFSLGGFVFAVISWMLAGLIAGKILRGSGYGIVMDVLLGLAGGLVGNIILSLFRLGWVGDIWIIGNIIVGVIGALILVWAVRMLGNRNFAR